MPEKRSRIEKIWQFGWLGNAHALIDQNRITERLEFTSEEDRAFALYLGSFLLNYESYEITRMSKHPVNEAGLRMPFLSSIARGLISFSEFLDRVSKNMMEDANTANLSQAQITKLRRMANLISTAHDDEKRKTGGNPKERVHSLVDHLAEQRSKNKLTA
jgi:hypothetical protein